jgi:hypothetical protein
MDDKATTRPLEKGDDVGFPPFSWEANLQTISTGVDVRRMKQRFSVGGKHFVKFFTNFFRTEDSLRKRR